MVGERGVTALFYSPHSFGDQTEGGLECGVGEGGWCTPSRGSAKWRTVRGIGEPEAVRSEEGRIEASSSCNPLDHVSNERNFERLI